MINSRNSQKNSRYFTKTQEILPKTQENFRKTQVFANSELEIVAEKRPKKEPRDNTSPGYSRDEDKMGSVFSGWGSHRYGARHEQNYDQLFDAVQHVVEGQTDGVVVVLCLDTGNSIGKNGTNPNRTQAGPSCITPSLE